MSTIVHFGRFFAPTVLLLHVALALASTQTGQLFVTVKATSGEALAGVDIQIRSPDLIGGSRREKTDGGGALRFINIPPGTYEVVATYAGFRVAKASDIVVNIGRTSQIDFVLQITAAPSEGIEEILVLGARTTIDVERVTLGGTVTDGFAENIPSARSYQAVSSIMPGVVDVDNDGNANVFGGTNYGNQYLLDGMNITDPVTNTFSGNFNFDAIREVEVLTGGRDAEYGSAVGGVVNIVTKSGGNEHFADASLYFRSAKLQLRDKNEKDLDDRRLSANLNVGGPISRDKLWYFASLEVPWSRRGISTTGIANPWPEEAGHPPRDFLGLYGLGKLTWQASDNHTVRLLLHIDPAQTRNTLADVTVHPDAEREQIQTGFRVAVASDYSFSEYMSLGTRLAFSQNGLDIHPVSGNYELANHTNSDTGLVTINDYRWYEDTHQRIQFHAALSYMVNDFAGGHQLKIGLDAAYTRRVIFESMTGGGRYYDVGPANEPYLYEKLIAPQDASIWGDTEGLFVQDVWRPLRGLTIRVGLRFDSARMRDPGGEAQIAINTLSPRCGVSWDPFDDGKTAVRAGYYQYVDTGYLTLADFAGGSDMHTRTYEYNVVTGRYDVLVKQDGTPSSVVTKPYLKDAWNQQRPRTHELIFGLGREFLPNLAIEAAFTYRFSSNNWEDTEDNLIWDRFGNQVLGYRDGNTRHVYSMGALKESFIRYYGAQVVLNKHFAENWNVLASYVWSKTQGTQDGIINESFDRPFMRDYEFGNLDGDVRHAIKVDGSHRLLEGFVIGLSMRYMSGAPYNRYYYNNAYFGDYGDRRAERGSDDVTGEELRLPSTFTINMRLKWDAQPLTGHRLEVIAEVFNVLNARTTIAVEERNVFGGDTRFGDTTDKLSPLAAQVGIRYRY